MSRSRPDRRTEHTREALRGAFVALFFEHGYDEFTISDVARRAGVGRSTVYEHYRGKEALLFDTIAYPFEQLARVVGDDDAPVLAVLQHFWANRGNARATRRESSRRAMARVLAVAIEARLRQSTDASQPAMARLIAEAMLGVVAAWLAGDLVADAASLARLLRAMTHSALAAGRASATMRAPQVR